MRLGRAGPWVVALAVLLAATVLGACGAAHSPPTEPLPGRVADVAAFDAYIAGKPSPAQFRLRYPDVTLILPGMIATKELRGDRSRYFAEVDDQGRIVGGRFM